MLVHRFAVATAIATYLLISHYFIKSVKVVGTSMVPTLQEGSQYLLDRAPGWLGPDH